MEKLAKKSEKGKLNIIFQLSKAVIRAVAELFSMESDREKSCRACPKQIKVESIQSNKYHFIICALLLLDTRTSSVVTTPARDTTVYRESLT